jgi:hypothetical protein
MAEDVEKVMWLRPNGKALRRALQNSTASGQEYAALTVRNVTADLGTTETIKPSSLLKAAERRMVPNYVQYMDAWKNHPHGIGRGVLAIFLMHCDTAVAKEQWDAQPGSWSPEYFLSQREQQSQIRSRRSIVRAEELLQAMGLLRLVKRGDHGSGKASIWQVRIPRADEADDLTRMALEANLVFKSQRTLSPKVRTQMRKAARLAGPEGALPASGSFDATPDPLNGLQGVERGLDASAHPHSL